MQYRAPRGTTDILPADQPYWHHVVQQAERLSHLYGYQRLDTPLFEAAGLFQRGIGEGTDIVDKEMYTFEDRSKDLLTLRPEGTAPVCRAYVEHGMHNLPQPVKLYYIAPSFRYERPQAGRYRQFYQFGCEALGEDDPSIDAEIITLAYQFYEALGLKNLRLLLNSIGDPLCRPSYLKALVEYYRPYSDQICEDCQMRFDKNPLRLLDCKRPSDQARIARAPKMVDFLCTDCQAHFTTVQRHLNVLGIPYRLEHRLVRGLDYYTRTVFEFVPQEEGSAQSTVGAGGRYDGLVEALGGKPTPGIGFGIGMERIIINLKQQGIEAPNAASPQVYVAYVGATGRLMALRLASDLRAAGVNTILALGERSLRAQLRNANSLGAPWAAMIGDDEVEASAVRLRDMATGEQKTMSMEEAVRQLSAGDGTPL